MSRPAPHPMKNGVWVSDYAVLENTYGKGRRPSDHMSVLANIILR